MSISLVSSNDNLRGVTGDTPSVEETPVRGNLPSRTVPGVSRGRTRRARAEGPGGCQEVPRRGTALTNREYGMVGEMGYHWTNRRRGRKQLRGSTGDKPLSKTTFS